MSRAVSIAALLCLFLASCAQASTLGWIVIPGLTGEQSTDLLSAFDVRSTHPDMTLIVGTPADLATLQTRYPAAALLRSFDAERTYYIIERTEFDFSTADEKAAWAFEVVPLLRSFQMRIMYASGLRYAVSAPKNLGAEQFDAFPTETEFITLPAQRILPLSATSHATLAEISKKFARRADIADLVAQVDSNSLTQFDLYLSGERNDSSFTTRNSFSTQATTAANWIASYFTASGFKAELKPFQATYGPNVIATFPGTEEPDKFVIVGAHFDSRATDRSSTTQRAPGANDDGSGTSILLEIARLIAKNNLKFRYSVILGSWCGEEQGLVGSRAYAAECRSNNVDIIAMLQGDMLAYRRPGEAAQCAFPDRYHDPALTSVVKNIIKTYVPAVQVCDTSSCCSDQQSFYEQGYSATFFFERCGSIADNQYHREGDLVNRVGFDIEQWTYNAQSMFASVLTLAEVL